MSLQEIEVICKSKDKYVPQNLEKAGTNPLQKSGKVRDFIRGHWWES